MLNQYNQYNQADSMTANNPSLVTGTDLGAFLAHTYAWVVLMIAIAFASMSVFAKTGLALSLGNSFICLIGSFGLIFLIYYTKNVVLSYIGLVAFSVLTGLSCSSVFLAGTRIVMTAFIATGVDFGTMSLIGIKSKKNFARLGHQLFAALIGLCVTEFIMFILGLLHIITISPMAILVISGISAILFSLYTVYDSHRLVANYKELPESLRTKASVIGALNLFMDFINIFLDIVNILLYFSGSNNN